MRLVVINILIMKIIIHYFRSSPTRIFILSFFLLIVVGSVLLILPPSTYNGINPIDALFTSTSAVCVTGLTVVNTHTCFTLFGQTIIMLLIQIGGLGIFTFASYFSFSLKKSSSYENQIALWNITNARTLGGVFNTLKQTITITLLVESIGACLIFSSIDAKLIPSLFDRIYISIFHSISAFCNAGFSTLENGIMEVGFLHNYPFQLSLIFLFIFGGLGFPLVSNLLKYFKYCINRIFNKVIFDKNLYKPWILSLESKINIYTIVFLILGGTVFLLLNEYNTVLESHSGVGKFVTALFTATTPRTAGFNTIDFSQLHMASILVIILLMWIGASPSSTGGGIKTSTFAVAILNIISLGRGKSHIEIFNRQIANVTVRRAFAIITLSLILIGTGVALISYFDNHLKCIDIIFECFSAYSTVGLTLGITTEVSIPSKIVLISLMFIGRVSVLTFFISFFKKPDKDTYTYPIEEILIN